MNRFRCLIISSHIGCGDFNAVVICSLFNKLINRKNLSRYHSLDSNLLFIFHCWKAGISILEIEEIKTGPYVIITHPFTEHLIENIYHEL